MPIAQEIKGSDYLVQFDPESTTVNFIGELSLSGPVEYEPIANLLNKVVETHPSTMTVDLRELAFLNSSGISMLSKFVLGFRKKKDIQMVIIGSNNMPWQGKSLKNLEKLLPGLKLEIE